MNDTLPAEATDIVPKTGIVFRPWRVAAALCLIPSLILLLRWEMGLPGPEALGPVFDNMGATLGDSTAEFLQRLTSSTFKVVLVLLILVAVTYAVLQVLGFVADRNPNQSWAKVLRILSGRPGDVKTPDTYFTALRDWGGEDLISPLRLGLSVFPMLGFLGTVSGLSVAIRDLPAAVEDQSKLGPVLDSLHVAFDTTFLGLVGAILCLVAAKMLENQTDSLIRQHAQA